MKTKSWVIYLIENRLGQLYCGISSDLERRFSEHQKSGKLCAKALRGKGPLVLRFAATLEDRSAALKCEYWMKSQNRNHKDSIIAGSKELPFVHELIPTQSLQRISQIRE